MDGLRQTWSKMAISVPAFIRNIQWKRLIADPFPFLLAWVLGALLTIVLPRRHWKEQKQEYYDSVGYAVEYEQAQRQNNQNNNNQNNNNQNNNNQNNNSYYQSYMSSCSWWDFSCRKRVAKYAYLYENNGGNNGNNRDNQVQVPNWYTFMGGTLEEDRHEREREGMSSSEASGTLRFVYAWTLALFVILVLYGAIAIARQHTLNTIRWCLLLFANVALLIMLLCVQGVIETDGRAMEDSIYGWYGQLGVLMVYSCFAYLIFSFVAAIAISVRIIWVARSAKAASAAAPSKEDISEFTRPKVSVTGSTKESNAYHEYKDLA
jgi:hypothetical protein